MPLHLSIRPFPATNKVAELCRAMSLEFFPKGSVVLHQGDYGDKFYVILEGKCVVKISEDPEHALRAALAMELQAGSMA